MNGNINNGTIALENEVNSNTPATLRNHRGLYLSVFVTGTLSNIASSNTKRAANHIVCTHRMQKEWKVLNRRFFR